MASTGQPAKALVGSAIPPHQAAGRKHAGQAGAALERAEGPSAVAFTVGLQRGGEVQLREPRATMEGEVTDGLQRVWEAKA